MIYGLIYLGIVSLAAVILTVYDKIAAKKLRHRRVPEGTLMTLGAIGGALAMYITMQLIRHKTKHGKFMFGLPILTLLHVAALIALHMWVFCR